MSLSKKRIKELKHLQENIKINYDDIPELTEDFWKNAKLVYPDKK